MAGVSYAHHTSMDSCVPLTGGIRWITVTVLSGIWRLYRYTNGGLTLTRRIGVEWNSENQNDYYYGVSRKESSLWQPARL